MNDFDEKTRVTQVVQPPPSAGTTENVTDCLVVIYTKEPTLLGKRFVLEHNPTRVGRGADNHVVLDGDSVSRRHAHFEQRGHSWLVVDDGSTNGTFYNDGRISREIVLKNGDRVTIGPTIFKFLSGADVEAQYHEEIYRMTIMDGLTQIHNKRYLYEALEREIIRGRRHERDLAILMFDIDHFKRVNEVHGHLAGDFVLKELARVVQARIRRDEVFARYGGEEFALILPETSLDGAVALADTLRQVISEHPFMYQADGIQVTISLGVALLQEIDRSANELIKRADEQLYFAKLTGRNCVAATPDREGRGRSTSTIRRNHHAVRDGESLLEMALKARPRGHLVAFEIQDEAGIVQRLGSLNYRAWFGELVGDVDERLGKEDALGAWHDRYVLAAIRGKDSQGVTAVMENVIEAWGKRGVPDIARNSVRRTLKAASVTSDEIETLGKRALDTLVSRLLSRPDAAKTPEDELPFPVAAPKAMVATHRTTYRRVQSLLDAIDATVRYIVAIEISTLRDSDDQTLWRRLAGVLLKEPRFGQTLAMDAWVRLMWDLSDVLPKEPKGVISATLATLKVGGPLRSDAAKRLSQATELRGAMDRGKGVSDGAFAAEEVWLQDLFDRLVGALQPIMQMRLLSLAEIESVDDDDGSFNYALYLHRGPAEHFPIIHEKIAPRLVKGWCYLLDEGADAHPPLLLSPVAFTGSCSTCGRVETYLADSLVFGIRGAKAHGRGVTTNHEGIMEVPWQKRDQNFHALLGVAARQDSDDRTTVVPREILAAPTLSDGSRTLVRILGEDQLRAVEDASIRVGLEAERAALLASLAQGIATTLPTAVTPLGQLVSDLAKLNAIVRAADGSTPLKQWLSAACALRGAYVEAAVFRAALEQLEKTLAPNQAADAPREPGADPNRK